MTERLEGLLAYMDRLIGATQYGKHQVARELNEVIAEIREELEIYDEKEAGEVGVNAETISQGQSPKFGFAAALKKHHDKQRLSEYSTAELTEELTKRKGVNVWSVDEGNFGAIAIGGYNDVPVHGPAKVIVNYD